MIARELACFFAALRFFTRLPVPGWVGHSQAQLDHAARYFPLVGAFVGAIVAAVTLAGAHLLPGPLAVALGMAAGVLITGAFHEDGFADACDGFGGGWDKAQVLAIMKDSRVGSYGVIGIVLLLLIKFESLSAMAPMTLAAALVAAHAASRFAAASLIFLLDYVRDDTTARAKPLARRMSTPELALAALFGLAPVLLLPARQAAAALIAAALATWWLARYFVRRIGGYTGDCLGAAQQVAETAFYLGVLCASS